MIHTQVYQIQLVLFREGTMFQHPSKRNTNVIGRHSIHYAIYLSKSFKIKNFVLVFITFYVPLFWSINPNKSCICHYISDKLPYHKFRCESNIKLIPCRIIKCSIVYIPFKFPISFIYTGIRILYIISCNFSEASGQNCSIQYLGPFFDLY